MIIEKLQLNEVDELLKLYEQLQIPFGADYEKVKNVYKDVYENDDYMVLAAKEEDKIIGTLTGICCYGLGASGHPFLVIEDVVVDNSIRGKGIGSRLFEKIDEFAKEKDCAYAVIVSSGFRKKAHHFYEKMGFTDDVRGFRKEYI